MINDYEYYGYPYMLSAKIGAEQRKKFKLNKFTAKQLYFLIECNTAYFTKSEGIKFYKDNFTIETMLSWNEEYVLLSIDDCRQNIVDGLTNETFIETVNKLANTLNIFVKSEKVIKKVIDFLEYFINNVGCFTFFRTYGNNIDDHTLYDLWRRILFEGNLESKFVTNNLTSISKFYTVDAEGFVPTLIYQEYFDLLNEFVERIICTISEKYDEKSNVMKSLNLWNGDPEASNIDQLNFQINRLNNYLKIHNII